MRFRTSFMSEITESSFDLGKLGRVQGGGYKPKTRDRLPPKHAHRKSAMTKPKTG